MVTRSARKRLLSKKLVEEIIHPVEKGEHEELDIARGKWLIKMIQKRIAFGLFTKMYFKINLIYSFYEEVCLFKEIISQKIDGLYIVIEYTKERVFMSYLAYPTHPTRFRIL